MAKVIIQAGVGMANGTQFVLVQCACGYQSTQYIATDAQGDYTTHAATCDWTKSATPLAAPSGTTAVGVPVTSITDITKNSGVKPQAVVTP